jgi:protein phosphatase
VPLRIEVAGKTDIGLVRTGNEDYLHLDEANRVYAVCDGMGGHQAGEVASMMASATIRAAFGSFREPLLATDELSLGRDLPPSCELLLKAVRLASRAVHNMALEDASRMGMGTTVVACALEADMMSIAHVGDSRAYRLDADRLSPLTKDHSWLEEYQTAQNITREEASSFVGKNVITRALGVRENVEIDYRIAKVKPGEIFLLCSDGLCGFADDDEIFEVATRGRKDLTRMASDLVQMANDRGGSDNVTVAVLRVLDVEESFLPELEVQTLAAESDELLRAEDEWVGRIRESLATREKPDEGKPSGGGRSRLPLFFIMAAFIVIAALVIYYFGDL